MRFEQFTPESDAIRPDPDPVFVWEIDEPVADQTTKRTDPSAHLIDRRKPASRIPDQNAADDTTPHTLKTRTLALLTRQLAALIKAGMPLVPALGALAEQDQSPALRALLSQLQQHVSGGDDFASALGRFPTLFSPLYLAMVQAGQASGSLDRALLKLADILENRARLQNTLRSTLAYPALMAFMALGVVGFLLAVVVPQIAKIFVELNRELPLITRILIGLSTLVRQYGLFLLAALAGTAVAGFYWLRSDDRIRCALDRFWLRLPLLGPFLVTLETARFARTCSMLLSSGLTAIQTLELARPVIQNRAMSRPLEYAAAAIERGASIAQAIKQTALFPPLLIHTIATGEQTGDIETPLAALADIYDTDLENGSRALVALIEPVILLIMGSIIGFIVMAILLPIFDINQSF